MRRIATTVAAIILVIGLLCGCTDGLSGLRINEITKIELIDLLSGNRVELDREDSGFETISPLITECQQSFERDGACQPEDGHQYQLMIYTGDDVFVNVIINEDGTFCVGKIHYVPASGSEGLALYIIRRAMVVLKNPYLLERPEEVTAPVELIQHNEWTYFCQQIMLDGAQYTVLARENEMSYQVVQELREPFGDRVVNSIAYVEGSIAASDGNMLYFSIQNSDTGVHRALGFSVENDTIVLLPEDACSNLLIIDRGNGNYSGWLVCGNTIFSVNLATGEMNEDNACTVNDLGGLPEIDGALFHDPQNIEAVRTVELAEGSEAGTIVIRIWQSENGGEPRMVQEYTYDTASSKLVGDESEIEE